MNVDLARQQLASKLSDVQEIARGVLRGVRRNAGRDVAVYLFDLNDRLAETASRLEAYQDEVIGRSYFDASSDSDLRWNHYLYMVSGPRSRCDGRLQELTKKVEFDQSYARKFVIDESDFEAVVARIDSVVLNSSSDVGDVMEVWSTKLLEAGLGCVLEVEKTIADTVRIITTGKSKNTSRVRPITGVDESARLASNWITDLDLSGFRQYPLRKSYQQLGRANLIFGTNGVGKTSLMEAVEFLYCGTNRRSATGGLRVGARLSDGREIFTASSQKLSDFDTRLRAWYGSENKTSTNKLAQTFARFNFLNTDAASELSLAKDGSGLKGNINSLAELVSGPGTATLWKRIKDVEKALIEHKKELTTEKRLRESEKQTAENELRHLMEHPQQADAEFEILKQELGRIKWRSMPMERGAVNAGLVAELAEAGARLGPIRRLSWWDGKVTSPQLETARRTLEDCRVEAVKAHEIAEARKRERAGRLERHTRLESQQRELVSLDLTTFERMLKARDRLLVAGRELKLLSPLVAAYDANVEVVLSDEILESPLAIALAETDISLQSHQKEIATKKLELAGAQKKNSLLAEMGAKIRQLAQQMLSHGHNEELCPVCSMEFEPGELDARIHKAVLAEGEGELAALGQFIDRLDKEAKLLGHTRSLLLSMIRFCEVAEVDKEHVTVAAVLQKIRGTKALWTAKSADHSLLLEEMERYRKMGISEEAVKRLFLSVHEKFHKTELSANLYREVSAYIAAEIKELQKHISDDMAEVLSDTPEQLSGIADKAGIREQGLATISQLMEQINLRLEAVSEVIKASEWISARSELTEQTDLRPLHSWLADVVLRADATAKASERETIAGAKGAQLRAIVAQRVEKIGQLTESLESVAVAIATIADLVKNSSMEQANERAIAATHSVANEVFARIHAPNEFQITADPAAPLCRKASGHGISLNEISTGQRAAYALSVFLAMNAQVRTGPKVVLLDDPISHIDDLNALSFLDYLRNLVLTDNRQVFFATADEKIAGLFAHKFSFLGSELRTIELGR